MVSAGLWFPLGRCGKREPSAAGKRPASKERGSVLARNYRPTAERIQISLPLHSGPGPSSWPILRLPKLIERRLLQ